MKQEIVTLRSQGEFMRAEHERDILELRMIASESQEKLKYTLHALNAEISQQKSHSEETIATLRNECARTRHEHMKRTEEYEKNVAELMYNTARLNKERVMRAKEFAEAQDLSSKLMALMGNKSTPLVAATAGCTPSSKHSGRYTAITANSEQENIQCIPQGPSASRPAQKRLRVRQGSQTPSKHQSKVVSGYRTVMVSLDGTGAEKRQPLEELQSNVQREITSVPARHSVADLHCTEPHQDDTAMQIEENGMSQIMCDTSFGESYVFTSTDHRKLSTQDLGAEHGVYDETTEHP